MGEGWAEAVAKGKTNVNGRRLIFFEPEGEHAAAAVTAGMSLVGLRSANFSSGQGVAYMHESLYAAVGKRLTYVLNIAARAITKQALNIHCGHDDYHAVDDTGFFQLFAKSVQEVADLNLIAHRIAELSLNPGICAQDGFLTSHVLESLRLPERGLVKEFLGDPADLIDSPTPAQRLVFGEQRRRIPELFDLDNPAILGPVQNQDSYAQGVAAQRPFYFDHIVELADQAFAEFAALTGRQYGRASAYRTDDAEYVIVGQGSVVENAEAVCDYLRSSRDIKAGVLNLTMFRPFPSDLVSRFLGGKRGVLVLERVDQPLAVDAPLLRELRAALSKAAENGRASNGHLPYPGLPAIRAEEVPDFYSGCYGLGSRDTQPGDIIAAVEEMLPGERGRRQFYLGIDFVRKQPGAAELQGWQQEIVRAYPHLTDLALERSEAVNLLPEGALALRIHSVGGWGAITMGKSISLTLFELLGLYVKSNPKYGSEKKGQPTTFFGVFAHEPVRLNCALLQVDIVLAPDPNVFKHSNPLAGLCQGGVFIIQSSQGPAATWQSFPAWARERIRKDRLRVFYVDGFGVAKDEASDADLRFRMQGAAFQGAFFKASPILERENLTGEQLFEGIHEQLQKAFGHRGARVVEDNLRVIRRGFDEVREVEWSSLEDGPADEAESRQMPVSLQDAHSESAVSDPHRFFDQVCALYSAGSDPIADPFAALSAIPAATGLFRDMTDIRMEVPGFIAEKCTGCGHCWIQCPDAAIPGLVSEIDDILTAAVDFACRRAAQGVRAGRVGVPAECRAARRARRRVWSADLGARGLPPGQDLALLHRARVQGEGQRRPALDHGQPERVQGMQPLRGGLPGRRARDAQAGSGDRRAAQAQLGPLGAASRHARSVRERARREPRDRSPPHGSPEEGELPEHGGRRQRMQRVRREDGDSPDLFRRRGGDAGAGPRLPGSHWWPHQQARGEGGRRPGLRREPREDGARAQGASRRGAQRRESRAAGPAAPSDPGLEGPDLAIHEWSQQQRSRRHGHDQRHGLLVGVG
jgi:pyruvate-ferredoxin/flavodoxin oxidoreductase